MTTLSVTINREVGDEEINDLIFGTGVLGHPWWVSAVVIGDSWRITHEDPEDEGAVQTLLTAEQICTAFSECIQNEYVDPGCSDTKEAIGESLGFLDANAADVVLQWAVFGEIIYS